MVGQYNKQSVVYEIEFRPRALKDLRKLPLRMRTMGEAESSAKVDIELHPEIWQRGDKRFVMLPYEEFIALQEALEDIRDLHLLKSARAEDDNSPGTPLSSVLKEVGLSA